MEWTGRVHFCSPVRASRTMSVAFQRPFFAGSRAATIAWPPVVSTMAGAETPMPGRRPAMVAGWAQSFLPSDRPRATVSSVPSDFMEVVVTTPPAVAIRLTALTAGLCQVGKSAVAASLPEQPARARVPARARAEGRSTGKSLQRDTE
ncbi:hypothetical protein ACFQE7_33010 [Nonomuraea ferruginea]|uniref:hypothetical protein n=1 Tax=Nonomuraea ferruginea TaxID=46174 RepID=UPI00360A72E2